MKKLIPLLLLFTAMAHAQNVNFEGTSFKAFLLATNASNGFAVNLAQEPFAVDGNGDGEIQVSEAQQVSSFYITDTSITNFTGLEAFTNLEKLTILGLNNLTASLPLSELHLLDFLEIRNTNLTSVNLSGLDSLTIASINDNTQMTSINTTGLADTLIVYDCYGNRLQSIDVSNFTQLVRLDCYENELTSLNVQGCTAITSIVCYQNLLTSIDFSGLENLSYVEIMNASVPTADLQISSLNLSGCTLMSWPQYYHSTSMTTLNFENCSLLPTLRISAGTIASINLNGCTGLTNLNIGRSSFNSIDLSDCTGLTNLSLQHNNLTSLDLTGFSNLDALDVSHGTLTSVNLTGCKELFDINLAMNPLLPTIDVSDCIILDQLIIAGNDMTSLFLKNGRNESIAFSANNNLQYVCADESQFDAIQEQFLSTLPNAVMNSYCSFVPGGNFNTITGSVPFDVLGNGCDISDVSYPYIKIKIDDGTNTETAFTNSNGNYAFYTQTGNFTVTPEIETLGYFNFSPAAGVINFPFVDNSVQTQNFCAAASGVHYDLEVVLAPITAARPGFDTQYKLVYKNKGNQTQSGSIGFTFDEDRIDLVSAAPTVLLQESGYLEWAFSNLLPFETRVIDLVVNVNSSVETPPVNIGDILHHQVEIIGNPGEETAADNVFSSHHTVIGAYDPNDKTCLEGPTIGVEGVGKYLHYNINFENVGNADAVNVVVKDLIDTTKFDINSLQLLYASHSVGTKIRNNVVEFIFNAINLPPSGGGPIGGHGNVLFKIKTLPTLVIDDEVANTANIFFDYNAPIQTNEARTVIAALSNGGFVKDESITIAPNPATNTITVRSENEISSMQLFDVQGRLLQTVLEHKNTTTLDISKYNHGVYFLKVNTAKGSSVEKIMKKSN